MARTKNGMLVSAGTLDQQNGDTTRMESIRRGKRVRHEHENHQSDSHSNDLENETRDMGENFCDKKTRGPTYMARVWVRRSRKEVEFNELGQAIGPNKSEYVEFIGTLVRNGKLVPLNMKDWHNVPKPLKSKLLELVKEKFCDAPNFEKHTMMNLAKSWRNWKNRVKKKYFDEKLSLEQNMRKRPDADDERVFPDQWKDFVLYWSSDAAKKISDKNKANRKKKTIDHITGKRSFAQVRENMKKELLTSQEVEYDDEITDDERDVDELRNDNEPTRMDLFAKCYTKNGETSNPDIADYLRKMKELVSGLPPGAKDTGPNDIFSQVAGQDKGGRVKMYGKGVTASIVYGDLPRQGKYSHTYMGNKNEFEAMKQRLDQQDKLIMEQSKQIQELIKMNKQRLAPEATKAVSVSSSHDHSISRRPSVSSSSMMPLRVGVKVSMRSLVESSKTVAIGYIRSLDPLKEVGQMRLGQNWCEVHINVGVEPEEKLLRPVYHFKTIGEVTGMTVAWPQYLVIMDA